MPFFYLNEDLCFFIILLIPFLKLSETLVSLIFATIFFTLCVLKITRNQMLEP